MEEVERFKERAKHIEQQANVLYQIFSLIFHHIIPQNCSQKYKAMLFFPSKFLDSSHALVVVVV